MVAAAAAALGVLMLVVMAAAAAAFLRGVGVVVVAAAALVRAVLVTDAADVRVKFEAIFQKCLRSFVRAALHAAIDQQGLAHERFLHAESDAAADDGVDALADQKLRERRVAAARRRDDGG